MVEPTHVTTFAKAGALLRITRVENCLMVAACTVLGGHLGAEPTGIEVSQMALAALVMALVLAYGNIINDVFDLEVDQLAKSHRPLPSGRISSGSADVLATIFAIAAFATSLLLPSPLALMSLAMIGLSYLYSWGLKGTPIVGNLTVAFMTGSTVVFGALAVGSLNLRVWLASLIIFWAFMLFEVIKDIEDRQGDARVGIVTIAHLLNQAGHLFLVRLLLVITVITMVVPEVLSLPGSILYWLVFLPLIPLALLAIKLPPEDRLRRYILTSKLLWLVGLIGLWALK